MIHACVTVFVPRCWVSSGPTHTDSACTHAGAPGNNSGLFLLGPDTVDSGPAGSTDWMQDPLSEMLGTISVIVCFLLSECSYIHNEIS